MADQVTFPPSIGGSGKTYTSDSNPDTGVFNGGHRINFFPMLADTVAAAGYVSKYAQAIDGAKANADRAEDARGYVESYAGALKNNIQTYYDQFASLKFDFSRGRYLVDDGELTETTNASEVLTVERATSKWVEGPNGKLREVPPNTIARQWRNGVPQGALIEDSATNLLTYSQTLDNAVWTKANVVRLTPNAERAPDGTVTADVVEPGDSGVYQASPVTEGETYTASVWAKLLSASQHQIGVYDVTNATWLIIPDGYITEAVTGRWTRVHVTVTAPSGCSEMRFYVCRGNVDKGSQLIWGAQFEKGTLPTSYIPTTDSPATCAASNVVWTLGNGINASEVTWFIEVEVGNPYGYLLEMAASQNPGSNRVLLRRGSEGYAAFVINGGVSSQLNIPTSLDGAARKVAISIRSTGISVAVAGEPPRSLLVEVPSDLAVVGVGQRAGVHTDAHAGGTVKQFIGFPRILTAAELQEITA